MADLPLRLLAARRGVAQTDFFARAFVSALTGTRHREVPEVRQALLLTLPEPRLLLIAGFFWTQVLPWSAFAATGARWPVVWAFADMLTFAVRWSLCRTHDRRVAQGRVPPRASMLVANLVWFVMMAAGLSAMSRMPDVAMAVLGAMVSAGFSGYVSARFAAFPRFATLLTCMIVVALTAGLLASPFPHVWLVGIVTPAAAVAFHFVMQNNYNIIRGAMFAQHENRRLSLHDALTGLPNRLYFHERLAALAEALDEGGVDPHEFAVLCLDLDGFKAVNDQFGHAAGDHLLRNVAQRLERCVGPHDLLSRIGGDEFVIILVASGRERAISVAETIIAALAEPHDLGVAQVRTGSSIGLALSPHHGVDPDELVRLADEALYDVKRGPKGTWHVHHGLAAVPQPRAVRQPLLESTAHVSGE